jgi:hypothetical protein
MFASDLALRLAETAHGMIALGARTNCRASAYPKSAIGGTKESAAGGFF